jgi:hypothetical protein
MCPEKWRMRDYGQIKGVYVTGKVENVGLRSLKVCLCDRKKERMQSSPYNCVKRKRVKLIPFVNNVISDENNVEELIMTQLQFNLNLDILKESVMDSNIDSVIKASIVLVLTKFMEKERDDHLKASAYVRTPSRHDYRHGYYERELLLSIGKIVLRVPRTRSGDFSTSVFEQYARCDEAFVLSMLEMVVNGVSTRKVSNIVEQLCGQKVSKSIWVKLKLFAFFAQGACYCISFLDTVSAGTKRG